MSKELFVEEGYNGAKYYDKDAVDALLAEKDAEIARLKAICKVHIEAIESIEAGLLQNDEEIRHHNYKRCLAMAAYCYTNVHCIMGHRLCALADWKKEWFERWHNRWLALAEKFKRKELGCNGRRQGNFRTREEAENY